MKLFFRIVAGIAVLTSPVLASAPTPIACSSTNFITSYAFGDIQTMYGLRSLGNPVPDGTEFHADRQKTYRVYQTCVNGWIVQYADNPGAKILFAPGNPFF